MASRDVGGNFDPLTVAPDSPSARADVLGDRDPARARRRQPHQSRIDLDELAPLPAALINLDLGALRVPLDRADQVKLRRGAMRSEYVRASAQLCSRLHDRGRQDLRLPCKLRVFGAPCHGALSVRFGLSLWCVLPPFNRLDTRLARRRVSRPFGVPLGPAYDRSAVRRERRRQDLLDQRWRRWEEHDCHSGCRQRDRCGGHPGREGCGRAAGHNRRLIEAAGQYR